MITTIAGIEAARTAIASMVRHTPVIALEHLQTPLATGARVSLKLENLQVTGSFKARGAMNKFLGTPKDQLAGGIVTASGGNHGLAVARTAFAAGVGATVFVPDNVSPAKVEKMRAWGATVEVAGPEWAVANSAALDFARRRKAAYFHPFADPLIVAGQGTLGLEVLDDLPDADAILVAIGGGGLISGVATAIRARRPDMRIIGVEPAGAPTLKVCLDAGKLVAVENLTTSVPTMAARKTDQRIYETVRGSVDDIALISDRDMLEASRSLWFEMGIAADLAGSASLAALRAGVPALEGARHICVLICGAGAEGNSPQA